MKIVQSFWSCNNNLIENSFGWYNAQSHLISWTLSCLSIKDQYQDLHLYTDSNGYKILIEYLKLPYTAVHICYDQLNPDYKVFWAIPKILTYAAQTEPFIHIDNDVFIWAKFNYAIEKADLIAQNLEIGTEYYNKMMIELKKDLFHLPVILKKELDKKSISSYNAGILGGSDIKFLNEYANFALKLIAKNDKKLENNKLINFNILFEQILFYCLAKKQLKKVSCYFDESIEDNGYTKSKISDFSTVPHHAKYIHLIGPHKREKETCSAMSNILLLKFPEYFLKIVVLFQEQHARFNTKIKMLFSEVGQLKSSDILKGTRENPAYQKIKFAMLIEEMIKRKITRKEITSFVKNSNSFFFTELYKYEIELSKNIHFWNKIPAQILYDMDKDLQQNHDFFFLSKEEQLTTKLERNPFMRIIETTFNWTVDMPDLFKTERQKGQSDKLFSIACIPELFFKGYIEIVIDDLTYNILFLLEEPLSLEELLNKIQICFNKMELQNEADVIYELILLKLKYLSQNKCVFMRDKNINYL